MAVEKIKIEIQKIEQSHLNEIDFGHLRFGFDFSDHMLLANYYDGKWQDVKVMPFQDIPFSPAACVFHYGQAIFEGLKAHKTEEGEILLFRPDRNFARINHSADRMCMPQIPEDIFFEGLKTLIDVDRNWVPEGEGKSLYIRPFLIADEAFLGVKPSKRYKFMIITSPASAYYTGAVDVKIETYYSRASPGGIGETKAAANYAASLYPAQQAQKEGFHQLIWTDAKEHKYIEESGTMNIMLRIGDTLLTPSLEGGSILAGITRDSIIQLAKDWGYSIEERKISTQEIIEALESGNLTEAFGMGTAATIAPIAKIQCEGVDYQLTDYKNWDFSNKIKAELDGIKRGRIKDTYGWTVKI